MNEGHVDPGRPPGPLAQSRRARRIKGPVRPALAAPRGRGVVQQGQRSVKPTPRSCWPRRRHMSVTWAMRAYSGPSGPEDLHPSGWDARSPGQGPRPTRAVEATERQGLAGPGVEGWSARCLEAIVEATNHHGREQAHGGQGATPSSPPKARPSTGWRAPETPGPHRKRCRSPHGPAQPAHGGAGEKVFGVPVGGERLGTSWRPSSVISSCWARRPTGSKNRIAVHADRRDRRK